MTVNRVLCLRCRGRDSHWPCEACDSKGYLLVEDDVDEPHFGIATREDPEVEDTVG